MQSAPETSVATNQLAKTAPGPRGKWLVGSMFEFQRDQLVFLKNLYEQYGDVVRFRVANWLIYQFFHPEGIRYILQENNQNFVRGRMFDPIRQVGGYSLFTTDGAYWLRQRRMMQPAFHRQRIAGFADMMTGLTEKMLQKWEASRRAGRALEISPEMVHLTMAVVTQALFGDMVIDESRRISDAIGVLLEDINYRFSVPFHPPLKVPTAHNRRTMKSLKIVDQAVFDIINGRRRQSETGEFDLLEMLMAARDEGDGAGMNDRQLRDEVVTMFVAGHETTARALSWAFYLLDRHPDVESRLHEEVDTVLNGRIPVLADVPKLAYTRMILDETLRLYPPVWITNREVVADDEVMGYHVPAGSFVTVSPYLTHRHPQFWEQPEQFEPERFSPEQSAGRPHYAYFPFLGGPHQCIGKDFALLEATLILAMTAQRYRLRHVPGVKIRMLTHATLVPSNNLPMLLEPRE